jgi:hypothetical protein
LGGNLASISGSTAPRAAAPIPPSAVAAAARLKGLGSDKNSISLGMASAAAGPSSPTSSTAAGRMDSTFRSAKLSISAGRSAAVTAPICGQGLERVIPCRVIINPRIVELRTRGISAISVNTWLRCINAYLRWKGSDLKIPLLTEERKILRTLTSEDVSRLLTHKTKSKSQSRIQSLAVLLLDTGLRIAEALQLRSTDVNLESTGGRKVLFKLCRNGGYLFPTSEWNIEH